MDPGAADALAAARRSAWSIIALAAACIVSGMADPVEERTPDASASTASARPQLPTGTVTFLMTDIEGSTRLLQDLGDRYPKLLDDHNRILREASASTGGTEASIEGDAFFFVFSDAPSALRTAADAQRRLAAHTWTAEAPVHVRMGIHTGEGQLLGAEYVGLDVHRAARITAAGHGGQVIVSDAARVLAEGSLPDGAELRDLGEHRLKDLARPERLWQLVAPGLESDFQPVRSFGGRPNNLPAQITSFVGRRDERQRLIDLVGTNRLVTLTGPGGTGKTRLSLEVAEASVDGFADGVFFVPVTAISDPELLLPTIAAALGVRESPTRPVDVALTEYLAPRRLLLILDNFEQLVAGAPAVGRLLATAPGLKILVTSREPLRVAGEQEFPVPPLALPHDAERVAIDDLMAIDSVALFVARARSVRPAFELTAENAPAVVEVCARLDGLPLAIELAAARTRLFEPRELVGRLDQRLSFLVGGRDVPERQRTLRGAIDWSHDLLGEPERVLFRRLSVFAGAPTIEAVAVVCRPSEQGLDPVDGISSLHEKSLLRRDEGVAAELRVSMLETIRDYARDRLRASGEAHEVGERHAAFFLAFAQRAAGHLRGHDQQRWLDDVDREVDEFRAAIRWAIDTGDAETGLAIATSLETFWVLRNHLSEGRHVLRELLALPLGADALAATATGLGCAAGLAVWQGDYAASRPLAERSLAIYRQLGDAAGIADQLNALGYATTIADPAAATDLFRESIDAYRQAGSPPRMGESLIGMALPEMRLRELEAAAAHLEEAAAVFRHTGDDAMELIAAGLLGICARLDGDLGSARRRYAEVLVRAHRSGADIAVTLPLTALADLALLEGDPTRAAVIEAAQARLAERLGGTPTFQLMGIPDVAERARIALGDGAYEAAAARGRTTPLDEIVRLALAGTEHEL